MERLLLLAFAFPLVVSCASMFTVRTDRGTFSECYVGAKTADDNVGGDIHDVEEQAIYLFCLNGQEFRIQGASLELLGPVDATDTKKP